MLLTSNLLLVLFILAFLFLFRVSDRNWHSSIFLGLFLSIFFLFGSFVFNVIDQFLVNVIYVKFFMFFQRLSDRRLKSIQTAFLERN